MIPKEPAAGNVNASFRHPAKTCGFAAMCAYVLGLTLFKTQCNHQHTCPPLKLCAVRRQDMPKKTSIPSVCMNSYGSSCLGSLKSHAARRAALTAAKIPLASFLGIISCSDPIDIHHASILFTSARSKTFGQNITKTRKRTSKNQTLSNRQTVVSFASGLAKKHFQFKF